MRTLQRRRKVHLDGPRSGPLRLTDAATLALSRAERDARATHWRRAAVEEYAQACAFGDLACRLRRLGAPADLVARCDSLADLGVDHARRCLELASRFAGHDVSPAFLRRPRCRPMRRATALARMAHDASAMRARADWYVAWLTDQRAQRSSDADVRTLLALLVADDGRDDVCSDVVAWCAPVGVATRTGLEDLARLHG
jgi:hypothetical protein